MVILEGGTAEYSCIEGYELNENGTRTCEPNGTWSGEEPICIRTLIVTVANHLTKAKQQYSSNVLNSYPSRILHFAYYVPQRKYSWGGGGCLNLHARLPFSVS